MVAGMPHAIAESIAILTTAPDGTSFLAHLALFTGVLAGLVLGALAAYIDQLVDLQRQLENANAVSESTRREIERRADAARYAGGGGGDGMYEEGG